jgi:ubiquinone/menaquinone biosynthesis C-methylase UbiE
MRMIEANNPFDLLATEYDDYRSGYSRSLYDQLAEFGFASGWNVLDVACGTAFASAPLAERGMSVTGVDLSEPMLARARMRIPQGTFLRGNAEALPFKDGQFDAALCAQAIHWMDQRRAVAEMARVVRPGGRVAVWWKKLIADDPICVFRAEAARAVGAQEPPDLMSGSFRAFYQHPFKERWLRVLPHAIMTNTERWIGYERTRARKGHFGEKFEEYLAELERRMREVGGEKPFQVKYSQFLYVGEV